MKKFINQDAKSPNIRLWTVYIVNKALWRHINRRSNVDVFEFRARLIKDLLCKFGETKISDFSFPVMNEYICNFQIPVNDILLSKIQEPLENISNNWLSGFLSKIFPFSEFALKISLIAELSDNITISITSEDFEASENVGMIEFFKDVNFRKKKLL